MPRNLLIFRQILSCSDVHSPVDLTGVGGDDFGDRFSREAIDFSCQRHGIFRFSGGCNELRRLSGVKVYALDVEKEVLENPSYNLSSDFGASFTVEADGFFRDGDIIHEAGMTFEVIATPGHTRGGCCFYFKEDGILLSGDTLFEESVGRTDFPGGSMSEIVRSVREKL